MTVDHDMNQLELMKIISVNQGLEASDTDSFQDSSLKLNVRPGQSRSSSLLSESSSQPEIHPFFKDSYGKFIVLYSYHGQDENDLSVERGQLVTVLNKVSAHVSLLHYFKSVGSSLSPVIIYLQASHFYFVCSSFLPAWRLSL